MMMTANIAPLRIAITVDPEYPVPPPLYGGVERIVDMLVSGLVARGHHVTLFAHPDSRAIAQRVVPWPGGKSQSRLDTVRNMALLARTVAREKFDVVHSNSRIAYLTPILPLNVPKIMTYHRHITRRTVAMGARLARGSLRFTAVSQWLNRDVASIGRWHVVPNGVPIKTYKFEANVAKDAPLVFLGRLQEIKGPHLAIEIAKRSGRALILAGNVPPEHQAWFSSEIQPHLDDRQIRFVGPVNDAKKSELLGAASALLMPILWDEPFGMVMTEAMACGTPVLALNRGAVSEIIEQGRTGFFADDVQDLVAAAGRIDELDRFHCRRVTEMRFSEDAVVEGYLDVYRQAMKAQHSRREMTQSE